MKNSCYKGIKYSKQIWIRNMERYSCNKGEVLNRLRKYEWSTRNTASRPSRLWDLAPKQSGEVIQSDRTVAKKGEDTTATLWRASPTSRASLWAYWQGAGTRTWARSQVKSNQSVVKRQSLKSNYRWTISPFQASCSKGASACKWASACALASGPRYPG